MTRGKKSAVYGALVHQNGNGQSVEVLEPSRYGDMKGGYVPEALDPILQTLMENVTTGAGLLQTFTPLLVRVMTKLDEKLADALTRCDVEAQLPEDAPEQDKVRERLARDAAFQSLMTLGGQVTDILERINKMAFNSARSIDTATRLRAFLAGVDEDLEKGSGLSDLSEDQLRRKILDAANGFKEVL